jgi:hypothetical protein
MVCRHACGLFFCIFSFFYLHYPGLDLIFIDLQFTTTKAKTENLAAGAEINADGRVHLPACGQGITVPADAVCASNVRGGTG